MRNAHRWLTENTKSKYMIIRTPVTLNKLNGKELDRVSKYKYLGFMSEDKLNFHEHVNYTRTKVIPRSKTLNKFRNVLNRHSKLI